MPPGRCLPPGETNVSKPRIRPPQLRPNGLCRGEHSAFMPRKPVSSTRRRRKRPTAGADAPPKVSATAQHAVAEHSVKVSPLARWYVVILCLVGAARIFVGAAGLPLFNDVDEQHHFDLVHKYARGYWPVKARETWDPETVSVQTFYGSPEYLNEPGPDGFSPPLGIWPPGTGKNAYAKQFLTLFSQQVNVEAHAPPVYYATAALWYDLGRLVGLHGPGAAYWVRFLNVPLYAALIAAAYVFCRAYFSEAVAWAVPALVAFFPNTVFYSINADVLSPLLVVLALLLLLRCQTPQARGNWSALLGGLMLAAAVLVKLTNVAILAACVIAVLVRGYRASQAGRRRREWCPALLLVLAAVGPVLLWMLRNKLVLGDFTGTAAKIESMTWSRKPFREWFDHPLFSLAGQNYFWTHLISSFYNGDMSWHFRALMQFAPSDWFFLGTFAALPVAGLVAWAGRRRPGLGRFHLAGGLAALIVIASVLVLMLLSVQFNFGTCVYPSQQHPYFISGRLIAGALVPFLALYVCSIEVLTGRLKLAVVAAVALSVVMMMLPQMIAAAEFLPSQYNWFHLPSGLPIAN
jgi:hypothetical protein